ncbi:MAG: autoinducer binding domain-containing protein [Cohaesibacter sp.]|nr:autoinducer binding domain-containing protein [Cohaesibacter sp.]
MCVQNRVFGYLDKIQAETQLDGVLSALKDVSDDFGYTGFILCGIPEADEQLEELVLLQGWSSIWTERYLDQNFIEDDPVVERVRHTSLPFEWNEVSRMPVPLSNQANAVMDEAASIGMPDGFCVPVYSPDGFQASLSFGGEGVDLGADDRHVLHLIGIYAHNQVRDLLKAGQPRRPAKVPTPREIECLKWASMGKTSWDISQILMISQHTADWYLASAAKKLGAVNRTQAVAEALRLGLIF